MLWLLWWNAYLNAITSDRKEQPMAAILPFPERAEPMRSASIAEVTPVGKAGNPSDALALAYRAVVNLTQMQPHDLAQARMPLYAEETILTFKPAMKELMRMIEQRMADVDKFIEQRKA